MEFTRRDNFSINDLSEHDIFWNYHVLTGNKVPNTKVCKDLNKYISFKKNISSFTIITYSLKPPKRGPDDEIYYNNPILVKLLPRGMTLIFSNEGKYLDILLGPCKFSGAETLDEDDAEDGHLNSVYNQEKTLSWVKSKNCEITKLTKANGKFAIMKLFKYKGKLAIAFGSKNSHHVLFVDNLIKLLDSEEVTEIVRSIGADILDKFHNLTKLLPKFEEGYSLVGELEDGMHFVSGDNTVSWFGLFKNGLPLESVTSLELLSSMGIKTVNYEVVFNVGDKGSKLNSVFTMSKCDTGEGSVLYIRNTKTGETQLAKSKSAIYKLKRMFRQKWLYIKADVFDKFKDRVVDTCDYHLLNTKAAIRITKLLIEFGFWLSDNNFPVGVLDFQPIKSVRGVLPAGFSIYWDKFIKETCKEDIKLSQEDFGDFNVKEFRNAKELELFPNSSLLNRPLVIFFQDIQGGGKSTITTKMKDFEMVEQDLCYGCTKATQFQLLRYIKNNKNVIVSRCNANSKQYGAYLNICLENNCRVLFISSEEMESELRLGIALSGILNRSEEGDNVMIGRLEYPFNEVIDFTSRNWKEFRYSSKVVKIKTFSYDKKLSQKLKNALESNNLENVVRENKNELMNLRLPLEKILLQIQKIIGNLQEEYFVKRTIEETNYISLRIINNKDILNCVYDNCNLNKKSLHCGHLTQVFLGKKKNTNIKLVPFGEVCTIKVNALVINNENGSSAFRVSSVTSNGYEIEIESGKPHITALVSEDAKPSDSKKFVTKTDDSVTIIPCKIELKSVCCWMLG
ncbi:MAG: hypothetical protein ACPGJP_03060 [Hyphomicrobiales bacterium]